jgi:hypothetical protein
MKGNSYIIAAAMILLSVCASGAQDLADNDLTIFGKPVKGKPNTYKFNSKYIVEIEKRPDRQVTSIYLHRKEKVSWKVTLSPSEVRDFFRRVNTVKDIGKPVYEAGIGFRYFEDVYQNAHLLRWLTHSAHTSSINALRVYLPYKINGVITWVKCTKPWVKVEIGDHSYYSFSEGAKAGASGEFWVIGPTEEFEADCAKPFTLQDEPADTN